ncbi:MAG: DUF4091 domain-containing protein, partial [Candidatus Electrothrix sp. EH2]|nr:DUF4091 domain-containing protein [Candidatus Electrothrix sp. EH2]
TGKQSDFVPDTKKGWQDAADKWVTWFDRFSPSTVIFKYMVDEPYMQDKEWTGVWQYIRQRSKWLHENDGVGKRLLVYCTSNIRKELEGYIDFWALAGQAGYKRNRNSEPLGYMLDRAQRQQVKGRLCGFYNGTRPSTGVGLALIDSHAVESRVNPWIAWKYKVDQYFFWLTNSFTQGDRKINPFKENYRIYHGRKCWGNGFLFYPSVGSLFSTNDSKKKYPIPSIRMKNWRRGQQDYEYLWLAQQAGIDTTEIVNQIVPRALSEKTNQAGRAEWPSRGYLFEAARRKLANKIKDKKTIDNKTDIPHMTR